MSSYKESAMEGCETLDRAYELVIEELKVHHGDVKRLSPARRIFLHVYFAQGILDNGGLQYFCESNFEGNPPNSEFIDAYNAIGANNAANSLSKAVAMFPFTDPHLYAGRRQVVMNALWEDEKSEFGDLDINLCGDESVWSKLLKFVEDNSMSFDLA